MNEVLKVVGRVEIRTQRVSTFEIRVCLVTTTNDDLKLVTNVTENSFGVYLTHCFVISKVIFVKIPFSVDHC